MNIDTLPEQPEQPASPAAPTSALQKRFDRLRKNLEREEKRRQKLVRELDELGHIYAKQVLPRLKNNHRMLKTLLQRLIDFSERKNLRQGHRETLEAWLYELLEQVALYDRKEAAAIAQQYMRTQLEIFGTASHIPQPHSHADAEADDDDSADDSHHAAPESDKDKAAKQDTPEADAAGAGDEAPERQNAEQVPAVDHKWLRQLFRRAAQALHPDREQDPAQREHKEQLMTELLQARDNNDMMAVMTLYQQHVASDALQIPESAFEALCLSVQAQIQRVQLEKNDYIQSDPQRAFVHYHLYADSRRKQAQNLDRLLDRIRLMRLQIPGVLDELRTLKDLKRELQYRQQDRF
ncbi:hypothetical protein A8C75_16500 [Marinobacterium aestuarii]|uniref:Molecular chaperone DnaJ n=1 Tax=Marinobacterium aestuarii TaxID=1821621 RepID=A0A1A9F214_9GAMM|nr:hypothetical protein [Marinobacterium aestuarii]ANG63918.1 hypothetical protein A8C75_16500 [Marinobacterium aestuarii]